MFECVIFAAVSTPQQAADDKDSLDTQVARSRAVIAARLWREAHEPIIVPGESRTELVSLSDAAREIPEIGQVLDLAREGRVNLVVIYDFNRFRVLIQQISRVLSTYGCQLYSLNQPVDPLPPAQFDEQMNDSAIMVQGVSGVMSDLQISGLRRSYKIYMPKRVTEHGIPYNIIPYGYTKPSGILDIKLARKAVPVQVPEQCQVLLQMKESYLGQGQSATGVARMLNAENIPSPYGKRWTTVTVLDILTRPFYAGFVTHGRVKVRRDLFTRKKKQIKTKKTVMAPGKHVPLWTEADWQAMVERRAGIAKSTAGKTKNTHYFSRLVVCAVCRRHMVAHFDLRRSEGNKIYYVCKTNGNHGRIGERIIVPAVREALTTVLSNGHLELPEAPIVNYTGEIQRLQKFMAALPEKRARFQRLYADKVMSYEDLLARLDELKCEDETYQENLAELDAKQAQTGFSLRRKDALQELLDRYDELIAGPPAMANLRFGEALAEVIVDRQSIKKIIFR